MLTSHIIHRRVRTLTLSLVVPNTYGPVKLHIAQQD